VQSSQEEARYLWKKGP